MICVAPLGGLAAQGDGLYGIILRQEPLPSPRQWQELDCLLAPTHHAGTLPLSYPVICILLLPFYCGRSCLGATPQCKPFPKQPGSTIHAHKPLQPLMLPLPRLGDAGTRLQDRNGEEPCERLECRRRRGWNICDDQQAVYHLFTQWTYLL